MIHWLVNRMSSDVIRHCIKICVKVVVGELKTINLKR